MERVTVGSGADDDGSGADDDRSGADDDRSGADDDRSGADDDRSEADDGGRTSIGEALGTTDVAVNHYRLPPGEGFPSGLHAHYDQEEVFVVLAGDATFEYLPDPPDENAETAGRELTVAAGEAIRFAPGEFQTGWNPTDATEDLVALAIGAPTQTEDVRIPASCPDCGEPTLRLDTGGDAFTFDCPGCDMAHRPVPCPTCGADDLQVRLDEENRPRTICLACESVFRTPPVE